MTAADFSSMPERHGYLEDDPLGDAPKPQPIRALTAVTSSLALFRVGATNHRPLRSSFGIVAPTLNKAVAPGALSAPQRVQICVAFDSVCAPPTLDADLPNRR